MRYRRLGRTGLSVSECTAGTSALRGPAGAMAAALECGVNAFEVDAGDIAAAALLGAAIGGRRDVHIFARAASLVAFDLPSPHVHVQQAYPGCHLRAQTEALLQALGVERLALLQLHAWCPEWLNEGDWRETLGRLREEGKIAGVGISLFDHDAPAALEAVTSGAIDAVQVMVNLFDPSAAAALLPLCRAHDVGVIARSPLYYGALAGRTRGFAADDWRSGYFHDKHRRETEERVARVADPLDTALRFALSHPAVSTVAVGMRTAEQLEANLRALDRGRFGAEEIAALAVHKWLC